MQSVSQCPVTHRWRLFNDVPTELAPSDLGIQALTYTLDTDPNVRITLIETLVALREKCTVRRFEKRPQHPEKLLAA